MKSILAALALLAALGGTNQAFAADRTTTVRVRNMTCALCPIIVQRALAAIPGVKEIVVSTDNGTATIVYNDRATNPTELAETIANAGYPSWPIRK